MCWTSWREGLVECDLPVCCKRNLSVEQEWKHVDVLWREILVTICGPCVLDGEGDSKCLVENLMSRLSLAPTMGEGVGMGWCFTREEDVGCT
jgi:hypothetical protein